MYFFNIPQTGRVNNIAIYLAVNLLKGSFIASQIFMILLIFLFPPPPAPSCLPAEYHTAVPLSGSPLRNIC